MIMTTVTCNCLVGKKLGIRKWTVEIRYWSRYTIKLINIVFKTYKNLVNSNMMKLINHLKKINKLKLVSVIALF